MQSIYSSTQALMIRKFIQYIFYKHYYSTVANMMTKRLSYVTTHTCSDLIINTSEYYTVDLMSQTNG